MISIYTDGSCLRNPGPGGWGCLIIQQGLEDIELSAGTPDTTNNKMELQAALEGLKWLLQNHPSKKATLYTDSTYVQQGITSWVHAWKRKNWRTAAGKPVKNDDLWRELDLLNSQLTVQWQWVKAHAGHPENERVDTLARNAAEKELS